MSTTPSRAVRLLGELRRLGLEALVVTTATNIRYLTGFTGSNGTVVVTNDATTLITDSRYTERAGEELASVREETGVDVQLVIAAGPSVDGIADLVSQARAVGLEADDLSWAAATKLQEKLDADRVRSTTGLVEGLRVVKSSGEIALMSKAAEIADELLKLRRQAVERRASPQTLAALASALNQSAYSHALDESDLPVSLEKVDEALAIYREANAEEPGGILDTRAYLRFLLRDAPPRIEPDAENDDPTNADGVEGDDVASNGVVTDASEQDAPQEDNDKPIDSREKNLLAALDDMERAVIQNEAEVRIEKVRLQKIAQISIDHLPLKYTRRQLDESSAVHYQHRGLIYEALGKTKAAEDDFRRARRLGYDPENGVW